MANILTILRLLLIPVIFILIINNSKYAVVIFGLAALTDLLDGLVARSMNQVTALGKTLDPFTDRLLIIGTVVALYLREAQPPLWMFVVIVMLLRDAILIVGYFILKARGQTVEVKMAGKITTAVLMVSFVLMIVNLKQAIWMFYFGFLLYLLTGFSYYLQGKKRLEILK